MTLVRTSVRAHIQMKQKNEPHSVCSHHVHPDPDDSDPVRTRADVRDSPEGFGYVLHSIQKMCMFSVTLQY